VVPGARKSAARPAGPAARCVDASAQGRARAVPAYTAAAHLATFRAGPEGRGCCSIARFRDLPEALRREIVPGANTPGPRRRPGRGLRRIVCGAGSARCGDGGWPRVFRGMEQPLSKGTLPREGQTVSFFPCQLTSGGIGGSVEPAEPPGPLFREQPGYGARTTG